MANEPKRCRTPEEAFEAGRELARTRGDRLSDTQAVRLAALVRPHLDRDDRDEERRA
jgi:hypothetical protein